MFFPYWWLFCTKLFYLSPLSSFFFCSAPPRRTLPSRVQHHGQVPMHRARPKEDPPLTEFFPKYPFFHTTQNFGFITLRWVFCLNVWGFNGSHTNVLQLRTFWAVGIFFSKFLVGSIFTKNKSLFFFQLSPFLSGYLCFDIPRPSAAFARARARAATLKNWNGHHYCSWFLSQFFLFSKKKLGKYSIVIWLTCVHHCVFLRVEKTNVLD